MCASYRNNVKVVFDGKPSDAQTRVLECHGKKAQAVTCNLGVTRAYREDLNETVHVRISPKHYERANTTAKPRRAQSILEARLHTSESADRRPGPTSNPRGEDHLVEA